MRLPVPISATIFYKTGLYQRGAAWVSTTEEWSSETKLKRQTETDKSLTFNLFSFHFPLVLWIGLHCCHKWFILLWICLPSPFAQSEIGLYISKPCLWWGQGILPVKCLVTLNCCRKTCMLSMLDQEMTFSLKHNNTLRNYWVYYWISDFTITTFRQAQNCAPLSSTYSLSSSLV